MPKLSTHQSSTTSKILLIGDSGSGKTGSLASLALAGYNLRIADMDNGVDILRNLLDPNAVTAVPLSPAEKEVRAAALDRVDYETITDTFKSINGRIIPKKADAWSRLLKLLDDWPGYGPVIKWTPQDVLVIDSLSFASAAAMRQVMSLNARLGQKPWNTDYGDAQTLVEGLCQYLFDESVTCNVVVISHIAFIGKEKDEKNQEVDPHGYPMTIGRALSPKVGRYFNSVLQVRTIQNGPNFKKEIFTQPTTNVELKSSAPNKVKKSYPIATGLADYFKDIRG